MASINRSIAALAMATEAFAAALRMATAGLYRFADVVEDARRALAEFLMIPFRWSPERHVELTHRLHDTRADDVRRNAPFKSFMDRARQNPLFVNDHFRAPVIVGT